MKRSDALARLGDKDVAKLVRDYLARGWRLKPGKRHPVLLGPAGAIVVVASTPGCRRGLANARAAFRRAERYASQASGCAGREPSTRSSDRSSAHQNAYRSSAHSMCSGTSLISVCQNVAPT